jgi:hypothetical protein
MPIKLGSILGCDCVSMTQFTSLILPASPDHAAPRSLADKLQAILKFVNFLAGAGILPDIIAQALFNHSWWRIALLVAQLAAQKTIAVANAVLSLVTKGRDLGDMLAA